MMSRYVNLFQQKCAARTLIHRNEEDVTSAHEHPMGIHYRSQAQKQLDLIPAYSIHNYDQLLEQSIRFVDTHGYCDTITVSSQLLADGERLVKDPLSHPYPYPYPYHNLWRSHTSRLTHFFWL